MSASLTDPRRREIVQVERLLLTVPEAAELLGIGQTKAYQMVRRGEWPVVRIGRSARISVEWLRDWVRRQTEEAEAELEWMLSRDRRFG